MNSTDEYNEFSPLAVKDLENLRSIKSDRASIRGRERVGWCSEILGEGGIWVGFERRVRFTHGIRESIPGMEREINLEWTRSVGEKKSIPVHCSQGRAMRLRKALQSNMGYIFDTGT